MRGKHRIESDKCDTSVNTNIIHKKRLNAGLRLGHTIVKIHRG